VEFPAAAQGDRLIIIAAADRYRNTRLPLACSDLIAENASPLNHIYIYDVVIGIIHLKSFPHLLRWNNRSLRVIRRLRSRNFCRDRNTQVMAVCSTGSL